MLVSTLKILLKYALLSAAPFPELVVAFPPLPLPLPAVEVEVTNVVVVAFAVTVVVVLEGAERKGVTAMVVVVIPDEMVSVSVVVVVVLGDAEGQVGNVTTEEMESAVRVSVVSCAWATAASRASRRTLVEGIVL